MRELPPCKDCEFRHPGCHAQCEPYKAWLEDQHAKSAYLAKNDDATKVIIDGIRKIKRKNHAHRRK